MDLTEHKHSVLEWREDRLGLDSNFKAGMHKPAEAKKASCAGCHHAGSNTFETRVNCKKCHVK